MKTLLHKGLLITVLALLIQSCTTAALDPGGEHVVVVDSISPTDLLSYDPVGGGLQSIGMLSVENCRNDLRNQAASMGATVLRISSIEPAYCALDGLQSGAQKNCFTAYGDAFKPKASKM